MRMNTRNNKNNYVKLLKAPYQLIVIMVFIVILIISMSIYGLYNIGCEQQKQRLIEIVQNQSVMIEEIVKHHLDHDYKNMDQVVEKNLTDAMEHAYKHFKGFGETGEFTLAKLDGENIVFLHHNRHKLNDTAEVIPFLSTLAEPMRRALNGESGNMLGLDYLGNKVLAAYAPVHDTGLGIVAKIDMSEIRSPYIRAGIYGFFGGLALIVIGSLFVLHFTEPLLKELEQNREYNRILFERSPIGLALTDMNGNMVDINHAYAKLIGRSVEDTFSLSYWDITPEKYADKEKIEKDFIHTGDGGFQILDTPLHAVTLAVNYELFLRYYNSYHFYPKLRKAIGPIALRYTISSGTIFQFDNNYFGPGIINCARMLSKDSLNRCLLDQNTNDWFMHNMMGVENLQFVSIDDIATYPQFALYEKADTEAYEMIFPYKKDFSFQKIISTDVQRIGEIKAKNTTLNIYNLHLQYLGSIKEVKDKPIVVTIGNLNLSGID